MRRDNKPQTYNFDRLLRTFRTKVKNSGKLEKLKEKQYYEKPAQKKQRLMNAAKRRAKKQLREAQLRPLRHGGK